MPKFKHEGRIGFPNPIPDFVATTPIMRFWSFPFDSRPFTPYSDAREGRAGEMPRQVTLVELEISQIYRVARTPGFLVPSNCRDYIFIKLIFKR